MAELKCVCPLTRGEKILAAVDGSAFSDAVVDQAISLGGICNSQIFVISIVDLYPEQMEVAPTLVEKMSEEAGQHVEQAKKKIDRANIKCETIVRMGGAPHKFIVQEAKDRNVDLILMGTHGRTGLKRVLMGSVAQNVIANAPCPVMVVPTVD
jgi:nucleotide-binding universal stress UspA family protein